MRVTHNYRIMKYMSDIDLSKPDSGRLFETASTQHGFFTAAQASAFGYSASLINHHIRSGRFGRVRRGVYRLRDYPSSRWEAIMAAWLAVGPERSLVSHESALELLELTDVVADSIHVTVPRTRRSLRRVPGVTMHTSTMGWETGDCMVRHEIRITSPTRTILDCATTGTAPEQIDLAVRQAVSSGMVIADQLCAAAKDRGQRVARLVCAACEGEPS